MIHFPRLIFALCTILTIQLNAQKISVFFTTTPTSTPSVSKAVLRYDKDFAYSYTFDDATSDAFTAALPVMRGGLVSGNGATFPGLFYTDGCGNALPFCGGIAWNTANQYGIDVHTGNVAGQLRWGQLDTLYEAGWDVMNHSYSHKSRWTFPMTATDYTNEIEQNDIAVRNKTRRRVEMPVFVNPASDDYYSSPALALGHKIVFDQSANTLGYGGLRVDSLPNLSGLVLHRTDLYDVFRNNVPRFIDAVASKSKNGVKMWYSEFSHRIDEFNTAATNYNFYYFKAHLESIANQYGKTGQDRMWMAPSQEVYEYLVMRQTADFTSQLVSNRLDISVNLQQVPTWLRRKTMTLVVNSAVDFNRVDVPSGVKITFKGIGNQKIINLDFTDFKVGTENVKTDPSVLQLFPNPVKNILTVDLATVKSGKIKATIFDISGKLMFQKDFEQSKFPIPTADLPSGLYFINVRQGEAFFRGKFVKE